MGDAANPSGWAPADKPEDDSVHVTPPSVDRNTPPITEVFGPIPYDPRIVVSDPSSTIWMVFTGAAGVCYALGSADSFAWDFDATADSNAYLLLAGILMILASACDMLDGAVARIGSKYKDSARSSRPYA